MTTVKNLMCCVLLLTTSLLHAKKAETKKTTLEQYLAREQLAQPAAVPLSLGSLWVDSGLMASLSSDYRAKTTGDVITIAVVQGLTSSNNDAVGTARTFNTSSGISQLPGKLKVGGVAGLLALNSAETLSGKGQASSAVNVTTTLAGRVVAVLASGNLVVEAERIVNMNREKQTIVLRGIVRPGDIGPNDTVASNNVGDLEFEVKGKGVISDGVRPPKHILRTLLNWLDF
jgi:flagellar L-ring protein precursor FlgH